MQRLMPPILFLLCLALMALLSWLWPSAILLPSPWHWLGVVPILLGLLMGALGARQFRKAGTNIRPFKEADTLVTTGPYRYTRNPMYLGITLVLLGAWIWLSALSPLLGVVIFVITADRWYIQVEEQMLCRKFGPAYEGYCSKVRRWI